MVSLDRHEFERPRVVPEYQSWVESRLDACGTTKAGKTALRLGKCLAKQLVEEAHPLSLFASRYFKDSDQVFITHVLGNQPYDATIDDQRADKAPFMYIEIALAHEGEDAHLRMCALERDGSVCPIGTVERTGNGPRVQVEAKSGTVLFDEEMGRIKTAIMKKADKTNYSAGTALVVGFDDRLVLRTDKDTGELLQGVQDLLDSVSHFAFVGCIGCSRGTFIDLRLGLGQ